jgi:hypothetical protein
VRIRRAHVASTATNERRFVVPGPGHDPPGGGRSAVARQNDVVTETGRPARLTSDEVALVLRRAAELDTADEPPGGEGFDPAALEEAAIEVGLSPSAVRQAVAELRVGALAPAPPPPARLGRRVARRPIGASSRLVTHQRLVVSSPDAVHAKVGRFMRTQMFELRRRSGDRAVYRQRSDLVSHLRRRLDFAGAIKLDGLRSIDVVATPADGEHTLVRVEADLAASRANALAGGAAVGSAVTVTTGLVGALFQEVGLVLASLPLGVMVGTGGMRVAGGRWRRRRDDVAEVLASLLDRL